MTGLSGETVDQAWRCEGYGRYAVPCRNTTRHESRFCGHHRNQSHWTALVNKHGEQGIITVEPTRTRWVVALGFYYGGRWNWERRYAATEARALIVRDEWVADIGSNVDSDA